MGQGHGACVWERIESELRWLAGVALVLGGVAGTSAGAALQAERRQELQNGDMESADADGRLTGWFVPPVLLEQGYVIGAELEQVASGGVAARIDSRGVKAGESFGNLIQSVDATPYRGKRVRFRALVRVSDAEPGGRAQLWLRVDRAAAGGAQRMGFFDNMQDRPIQSDEWQPYEIVGDVAEDAQSIVLGMLTLGKCVAYMDDATLDVVGAEEARPTGSALEAAPTQPLFTRWLALPLVAMGLFVLGFHAKNRLGKLAFEFTFAYWTLYALPTLVANVIPVFGGRWMLAWEAGAMDAFVRWTAKSVLGIEGQLVSPLGNGSGDTTFAYVQALAFFVVALVLAALWSLLDRRRTDHPRLKELLRTGLRWYLASVMLGYGLAKLGMLYNQFSAPGVDRLARTYGESSPMGLLWTFMGSSQAYTAFAGLAEFGSGLLLVCRRTALLGALASAAVMLNVMVLNFCYDVPVKLFSAHLFVAAVVIALPDAGRLAHVFLGLGRGAVPAQAASSRRAITWLRRAGALYLFVMIVGLPVWQRWRLQSRIAPVWSAFGEWKLATLELDGQAVTPATGEIEVLRLGRYPDETEAGWSTGSYATLVGGSTLNATAVLSADHMDLTPDGGATTASRLVPGSHEWCITDDKLCLASGSLRATFAPATGDSLLVQRGFRWINEHPFNR